MNVSCVSLGEWAVLERQMHGAVMGSLIVDVVVRGQQPCGPTAPLEVSVDQPLFVSVNRVHDNRSSEPPGVGFFNELQLRSENLLYIEN